MGAREGENRCESVICSHKKKKKKKKIQGSGWETRGKKGKATPLEPKGRYKNRDRDGSEIRPMKRGEGSSKKNRRKKTPIDERVRFGSVYG